MAIRSPPLHAVIHRRPAQQAGLVDAAIGDTADEARLFHTIDRRANHRVHPISANYGVGLHPRTIGKRENDLTSAVVHAYQLLVQVDGAGLEQVEQRGMHLRTVHHDVIGAVARLRLLAHGMQIGDFGGVPLAVVGEFRNKSDFKHPLLNAERARGFHAVGRELQRGADAREARCLLIHLRLDTEALQRRGSGEAAHAGADNRNGIRRRRHANGSEIGIAEVSGRKSAGSMRGGGEVLHNA
jgi:hypothetical protein